MNIPSIEFPIFLSTIISSFVAILAIIVSIALKSPIIIYKKYDISIFLINIFICLFFLILFISLIFYKSNDVEKFIVSLRSILEQYYHLYIEKNLLYNLLPFFDDNAFEIFFENSIFTYYFYVFFIIFTFIFTNVFLCLQLDGNIYNINSAFELDIIFEVMAMIGIIINFINNQLSLIILSTLIRYYGSVTKACFGILIMYFSFILIFYIEIRIALTIKISKVDKKKIDIEAVKVKNKRKIKNEKNDFKVKTIDTQSFEELLAEYASENNFKNRK